MRANIEKNIGVVLNQKIEPIIPIYTRLPYIFSFIVFLCPQGWMAQIIEKIANLLVELILDRFTAPLQRSLELW